MIDLGLSERRALAVVRMSASAYRYQPRLDRNGELRERILALAQRYKNRGQSRLSPPIARNATLLTLVFACFRLFSTND